MTAVLAFWDLICLPSPTGSVIWRPGAQERKWLVLFNHCSLSNQVFWTEPRPKRFSFLQTLTQRGGRRFDEPDPLWVSRQQPYLWLCFIFRVTEIILFSVSSCWITLDIAVLQSELDTHSPAGSLQRVAWWNQLRLKCDTPCALWHWIECISFLQH